ncbi:hypothetical protein NM688_g5073 [Phlebia brevispora]|uniref:Uncharacterized protein n=1 Tax=Phlebia brevispora TaxID=194682 RepID=A0ACC1T1Q0_9APHY|nr:hypothetical protein NM688_g5073 [Phlebia brevispora]
MDPESLRILKESRSNVLDDSEVDLLAASLSKSVDIHESRPITAPDSYIGRLPNELLEEIFIRCVPHTTDPSHFNSISPALYYRQWIHITRVCRHWYHIASQHPALWSYLSLPGDADFTQLVLSRSKDALIRVEFDINNPPDLMTYRTVVETNLHRIQHLLVKIDILSFSSLQTRNPLLHRASAPHLETYVLHLNSARRGRMTRESPFAAQMSPRFMPSLRRLRLLGGSRVRLEDLASMSSLQELEITFAASLSDILDVLEALRLLRKLTLKLPQGRMTINHDARHAVVLRHLRLLRLDAPCSMCEALLKRLSTPSGAVMDVNSTCNCSRDEKSYSYLFSPYVTGSSAPLLSFALPHFDCFTVGYIGWTSHIPMYSKSLSSPYIHNEDLAFNVRVNRSSRSDGVFRTLGELDLRSVQSLWISAGYRQLWTATSALTFASAMTSMPNIIELRCQSASAQMWTDILQTPLRDSAREELLWPLMTTLILSSVEFSETDGGPFSICTVKALRDALLHRQSKGCVMLEQLFIFDCGAQESDFRGVLKDCTKKLFLD